MGLGDWIYRKTGELKDGIYEGSGDVKDYLHRELIDPLTGKAGADAARDAARTQAEAADKATQQQRAMFDKTIELNEPWRQAGIGALGDLADGLKSGAFEAPNDQFSYEMPENNFKDPGFNFNFQEDPGYKFRAQQQDQAVQRSAAAAGGMFSGATLSDLASKRGEMASAEYGNAYNRARGSYENDRNFGYNANRDAIGDAQNNRNFAYGNFSDAQNRKKQGLQDRFSRLSTLAGLGDSATGRSGNAAQSFGDRASSNILDGANARAAGMVGAANAQQQGMMGLATLAAKIYGAS